MLSYPKEGFERLILLDYVGMEKQHFGHTLNLWDSEFETVLPRTFKVGLQSM